VLRIAIPVIMLLALAMSPPAQAASHGAAWHSKGVAISPSGQVFGFELAYHGQCTPYFTADVRDLATGAILEHRDFAGYELQTDVTTPFNQQNWFSTTLASTTPGVTLAMTGYQIFVINQQIWHTQAFTGTYQTYRTFIDTVVEPWTFCS
jgi:hypothetical protein